MGGISTGPQRTGPGTEAAAGAWVKVWSPRCSTGHLCHLQMRELVQVTLPACLSVLVGQIRIRFPTQGFVDSRSFCE